MFLDIDASGCDISCVESGLLAVVRGSNIADGCLAYRHAFDGELKGLVLTSKDLQIGDRLSIALVVHCKDRCARCAAVQEGIAADDQGRVLLVLKKPGTCVAHDRLPSGQPLPPACGVDAGPPDGGGDSAADQGPGDGSPDLPSRDGPAVIDSRRPKADGALDRGLPDGRRVDTLVPDASVVDAEPADGGGALDGRRSD